MAEKDREHRRRESNPAETEPYAPPRHPDVHVPDQQFEGNPEEREGKDEKSRKKH